MYDCSRERVLRKLVQSLLLLLPFICLAQIPSYYSSIDFNLNGTDLRDDLTYLVGYTQHTALPYTSSSTDTWDSVTLTDEDPNNNSNVLLFYGYDDYDGNPETDYTRDKTLSCHATPCTGLWTREHVFAKSLATPPLVTTSAGSGTDVHNLRACDGDMNTTRSNRLFEDGSGNAHITGSGNWYPGDEWKGDVARIIMYMYVRYPDECLPNNTGTGANMFSPEIPDVFLDWNVEDPVSQYETRRNTVLESMQGNRNPFIDNPYLATKIWGGTNAEDTWGLLGVDESLFKNIKVYPTIANERLYITNATNKDIEIVVYDIKGHKMAVSVDHDFIDVKTLDNGFYFLKIDIEQGSKIFKFIKN